MINEYKDFQHTSLEGLNMKLEIKKEDASSKTSSMNKNFTWENKY